MTKESEIWRINFFVGFEISKNPSLFFPNGPYIFFHYKSKFQIKNDQATFALNLIFTII